MSSTQNGYNAPRRYAGCNDEEDRIKRAADFMAEVRRQLVTNANDKWWMERYHEADRALRQACSAYLESPVPIPKRP